MAQLTFRSCQHEGCWIRDGAYDRYHVTETSTLFGEQSRFRLGLDVISKTTSPANPGPDNILRYANVPPLPSRQSPRPASITGRKKMPELPGSIGDGVSKSSPMIDNYTMLYTGRQIPVPFWNDRRGARHRSYRTGRPDARFCFDAAV